MLADGITQEHQQREISSSSNLTERLGARGTGYQQKENKLTSVISRRNVKFHHMTQMRGRYLPNQNLNSSVSKIDSHEIIFEYYRYKFFLTTIQFLLIY
jgi:hypothetical protein